MTGIVSQVPRMYPIPKKRNPKDLKPLEFRHSCRASGI